MIYKVKFQRVATPATGYSIPFPPFRVGEVVQMIFR